MTRRRMAALAAAISAATLAACGSTLNFEASVVPRYLCGDVTPAVTWRANRAVRVTVTDAKGQPLYVSTGLKQEELNGRLQAVTANMLPMSVQVIEGGSARAPLDVSLMQGEAWFEQVEPTNVEYSVYEGRIGEGIETDADKVPYIGKPATAKGTQKHSYCRNRNAQGLCLDTVSQVELWEVGVIVSKMSWNVRDLFSTDAAIEEIVNNTTIPVRVGNTTLAPGESIAFGEDSPEELTIEATIDDRLKIKCGLERRFDDGRCVASEGLAECRNEGQDGRLSLCAAPKLGLRVRATCG